MNNKDKYQHLYEVYQYTVNFDFSKLNKYKKADEALCISDLILDYRMLFELNQQRTKELNSIINKAIEYIMTELITEWEIENDGYVSGSDLPAYAITPLLDILRGE